MWPTERNQENDPPGRTCVTLVIVFVFCYGQGAPAKPVEEDVEQDGVDLTTFRHTRQRVRLYTLACPSLHVSVSFLTCHATRCSTVQQVSVAPVTGWDVLCSLVQSCAVLCSLVQSFAVLCSLVQSCAVLCSLVQSFAVLCLLIGKLLIGKPACRQPTSLHYPKSPCEKGYPTTDGVNIILPANQLAARQLTCGTARLG